MSSSTTSSSSSAPSSSYTGDSSGLGTTSSGQLPYSFLLTFVAVFLFFIGCGFGTRRLSIELRRTMVHAAFQRMEQPPAPELHDVYLKHARGPSTGKYRDFLVSTRFPHTSPTDLTHIACPAALRHVPARGEG